VEYHCKLQKLHHSNYSLLTPKTTINLRIIRGILKSRRFSTPKNFPSRPTTDFAKEGLFNILENTFSLQNLDILDLCAGTGNITYEFASREAGKILAVDTNYNCCKFIQKMVSENNLEETVSVLKSDIRDFVRKTERKFDLIFLDPPYESTFYEEVIQNIYDRSLLQEDGLLVVEHSKRKDLSHLPYFEKVKDYGGVCFSFFSEK
jgi:16S rRNA (guanine(966)-N(2))-methyltransferase RsmD